MTKYTESNGSARLWKWTAVVYFVAMHIFAVVLIVKTDFIPRLKARFGFTANSPQAMHFHSMLTFHRLMDETVPDKSVVFLGDGHVQALATAAVSPSTVNFGVGGESTAQLLEAIPFYKSLHRSSVIVLEIGISDIVHGNKSGLYDRYRKILAGLPQESALVWNAIMPIKHAQWMKMNLSDINAANHEIKSLCESRRKCIFVDTWSVLADKNGQIISEYYLMDGEYLSPAGFKAWVLILRNAVAQAASTSEIPPK